MKKTSLNKKRILRPFISMVLVATVTFFVSCEKNEELPTDQAISESSIIGDYSRLDATLVNSDNGTPQRLETLEAFLGDELQLLEEGLFKNATAEGHWTKEGQTLFLYPTEGSSIHLEIEEMDDQSLELSHKYESYNNYANGTITYTFVKKGSETEFEHDLLSSMDLWLKKL